MPKHLKKYLSKIKKPPNSHHFHLPSRILSYSSKRKILREKTRALAAESSSATLDDIDRFLFENFRSLYLKDDDDEGDDKEKKFEQKDDEEKTGGILFESPPLVDPPPNLRGSHRFFVGPASSGPLIEDSRKSEAASEDRGSSSCPRVVPDDFITVFRYSLSPYDDFKRSMEEMIEARLSGHGRVDWEFMEGLLFCYLDLNVKKSYKYILSAFVDLIVVLRGDSGKRPVRSRRVNRAAVGERR